MGERNAGIELGVAKTGERELLVVEGIDTRKDMMEHARIKGREAMSGMGVHCQAGEAATESQDKAAEATDRHSRHDTDSQ